MDDFNVFTVPDPEGDKFYMIEVKPNQGQMIFTIRAHDNETGELISSESHFENRYYAKVDTTKDGWLKELNDGS